MNANRRSVSWMLVVYGVGALLACVVELGPQTVSTGLLGNTPTATLVK